MDLPTAREKGEGTITSFVVTGHNADRRASDNRRLASYPPPPEFLVGKAGGGVMKPHGRLAALPPAPTGADLLPTNPTAPSAHRNGVFSRPAPFEDTGCGTSRRRALACGDLPTTPVTARPVRAAVRRVRTFRREAIP